MIAKNPAEMPRVHFSQRCLRQKAFTLFSESNIASPWGCYRVIDSAGFLKEAKMPYSFWHGCWN